MKKAKKQTEAEQSIKNGTKVVFLFKGMLGDWEDEAKDEDIVEGVENLSDIEGLIFTVINLATFTELGEKDYEYYNLEHTLPNGKKITLDGASGYHLEPTLEDAEIMDLMSVVNDSLKPEQIQQLYIMWLMVTTKKHLISLIKEF